MAATDSGGETGYESNDSNVTFETSKSDLLSSSDGDSMSIAEPQACEMMPPMEVAVPVEELHHLPVQMFPEPCPVGQEVGYSYCRKSRAKMLHRRNAVRWRSFSSMIPRIRSILGERKLRTAANLNNVESVEELLELGVDPCAADDRKRTALHFAACKGYTDIVHMLLRKGADPNQKDVVGNTPLHLAVCTNHINVVTLLLKAGADVLSTDFSGRTPLQLAQSKLRLLQLDTSYTSFQLKMEVHQVIEMLQTYLKCSGLDAEAKLMYAFSRQLDLTQSKEEVDCNVRDLLCRLSDLSLQRT